MATRWTDARPLLSTAEAARILGLSARSVRRAAQEGRLEGRQVDGRWLVDADAVAAMAERGQASGASGRDQLAGGTAGDVAAAMAVLVDRLADAERRAALAELELAQARRQLAQLEAPAALARAAEEAPAASSSTAEDGADIAMSAEAPRPPWWRRWWTAASSA